MTAQIINPDGSKSPAEVAVVVGDVLQASDYSVTLRRVLERNIAEESDEAPSADAFLKQLGKSVEEQPPD